MKMNIIFSLILAIVSLSSCKDDSLENLSSSISSSSSGQSGLLNVSFVGKYFRLPYNLKYPEKGNSIWKDTVWCNERIYNQILLDTGEKDLTNIQFEISDLKGNNGKISSDNLNMFSIGYVRGDLEPSIDAQPLPRATSYIADALIDSLPTELENNSQNSIWLSLNIPKECNPGNYQGIISIKSDNNEIASCEIDLTVTNHILPDVQNWNFHLDIWQFPQRLINILNQNGISIEPYSSAHFEILRPFYEILADGGQKAITACIKDGAFNPGETMVKWIKNPDTTWTFDYSDFDNYVNFMMDLGITKQINCFSLAGWNDYIGYIDNSQNGTYHYLYLPIGSDIFNEVWNIFLNDFHTHLKLKGWMEKTVIFMDENNNQEMQEIVKTIRKNNSEWKIGLSGKNIDSQIERELYNYSTIIGVNPHSTILPIPIFYTSCSQKHPNNFLTPENSSSEMTWMAWHAWSMGYKGYQRWAFDNWFCTDPFDACDRANTAGDFHMIYRNNNGPDVKPIRSIRWELLRDGIQDYEKCQLLDYRKLTALKEEFKDTEGINSLAKVLIAQSYIKKLSIQ